LLYKYETLSFASKTSSSSMPGPILLHNWGGNDIYKYTNWLYNHPGSGLFLLRVGILHKLNASENMFLCKSNVNQLLFFPTFSNFRIYKCFHVNQTRFLITYLSYVLILFAIKLSVFFFLLFLFLHLS
jgi:hypothetical protein